MRHLVRPQANSCRETLGALNFRPTKSSTLAVACPASAEVLGRISGGRGYGFRALKPPETAENEADAPFTRPAPSPDYLDIDRTHTDLARVLRNLYRRSTQAYLDQGLSVLYLAFGTLDWMDVDNTRFRSPLLLVPVRLTAEGPKAPPRLEPTDDDTVVNPVLALKLDQCGITLPSADALEDGTLSSFLDAARSAVAEHKGWSVGDDLVLSYFSFNKEAMYRDLKENEDRIAKHDAVAAVALGGGRSAISGRFAFEEIRDGEIDEKAAPETTPVILDADSSQRACIAAALAGKSFVMDGPPGTGKSQTIANIIGALLHKGKTVLFVSEKAAALDVVRNRLADVGLHSYLLELHSSKATRKQVAEELGTALTNELVPPDALAGLTVQQALQGRQQLNAYADAMNRPREPLNYSLHQVLGIIALLNGVPAAPLAGIPMTDLTVAKYTEVKSTAKALADAWRPARQGATFAWRGVSQQGSLEALLYQATSALATLSGTAGYNAALGEAVGLTRPSDAPALAVLLDHHSARPPVLPGDWLTTDHLKGVGDSIGRLDSSLTEIGTAEHEATDAAGTPWQVVPRSADLPAVPDLTGTFPRFPDLANRQAAQIAALAGRFRTGAGHRPAAGPDAGPSPSDVIRPPGRRRRCCTPTPW